MIMIHKRGGMDISGVVDQKQSISDDQELAKALAGVTQETEGMTSADISTQASPVNDLPTVLSTPVQDTSAIVDPVVAPDPISVTPVGTTPVSVGGDLADVKQAALSELRPLISKLEVSPEEKFNTYLLLIRSTDDQSLIAPAHEAAQSIVDEAKKAQALLDIIKEIDYLSNPQQ